MDLNLRNERVWAYYDSVLGKLAEYGAAIVRLDAFAYAPKTPGLRNFMNEPDTWDTLERIRQMADSHGLTLCRRFMILMRREPMKRSLERAI